LGKNAYTMTNTVLGILTGYSLRDLFKARPDRLYLRLRDGTGRDRGVTVYNATIEKLLPFLIQSLKTAGYQGTWRIEDPPLTQFLEAVRSFDPIPNKPSCHKCGEALLTGQKVISIKSEHRHRIYHESCYESTLH